MMFKTCASLAVLSAHVDALKANMMTKNNKVESNLPTLLTSKPKNQGTNTAPNSGNGNLLKYSDVKTKVPTKTTAKTGTTKPTTTTGTPTKTTAKTGTPTKTGTTKTTPKTPNQWKEYFDPKSGYPYYHNPHTGETTWEKPKGCSLSTARSAPPVTKYHSTGTVVRTRRAKNDEISSGELIPPTFVMLLFFGAIFGVCVWLLNNILGEDSQGDRCLKHFVTIAAFCSCAACFVLVIFLYLCIIELGHPGAAASKQRYGY